jgi:hypothetical protein
MKENKLEFFVEDHHLENLKEIERKESTRWFKFLEFFRPARKLPGSGVSTYILSDPILSKRLADDIRSSRKSRKL